jgi:hypothetical protein
MTRDMRSGPAKPSQKRWWLAKRKGEELIDVELVVFVFALQVSQTK